jgi:fructose-1,6-bisphosphatase/inositol monophosphatase family enzyme
MLRHMSKIDIEVVADHLRAVANEAILPRWRNLSFGDIAEKSGPDDLVTVADKAAEAQLTARLSLLIDGSQVIGEEAVSVDPRRLGLFGSTAPVWVIDPIDGTQAFANGEPQFDVMVALIAAGELLAAWIYNPVSGEIWMGERGSGVRLSTADGHTVTAATCNKDAPLGNLKGLVGRPLISPQHWAAMQEKQSWFASLVRGTTAGRNYARVLAGEIDFMLFGKCLPWDHLPGLMLLQETGHVFAKHDASPYRAGDTTGGLLTAPSPERWREIKALLLT